MTNWEAADDALVGLTDDALVEQAIRDRSDARLRRVRQSESATLIGTLVDLAETQTAVTVDVTTGRTLQGRLLGVAADHVVLALPGRARLLVRTSTITSIRPDPGALARAALGERESLSSATLMEVLADIVETEAEISIVMEGSTAVLLGTVLAVGEDIVSLRLQGQQAPIYLVGDAMSDIIIPDGRDAHDL